MNKEKGWTPTNPSIAETKKRKFTEPKCSQTQTQTQTQSQSQSQGQSRPMSQLLERTLRIDPIASDNLDELLQVWNEAKENPIQLSEDQIKLAEMEKYLHQIKLENQDLQDKISKRKEKNEKMTKYIEQKVEANDKIVEKQNLASNLSSMAREHIDALSEEIEQAGESIEHLEELYESLDSKGLEKTETLTRRLDDLVSEYQKLEAEFDSKCQELTIAETRCEETENEIQGTETEISEVNRRLQETEAMIETNEREYAKQMAEKIRAKTIVEESLKIAKEENCQINAEHNKILKTNEELVLKLGALKAEETVYTTEVESLKSKLSEHEAQGAKLNDELDEANNAGLALVSKRDSELAEYRKTLQDLTSEKAEVTKNLKEAVLEGEELSKTLANATVHKEQLKKSVENKDKEIKKLTTEASDASNKNKELLAGIKSLKEELAASENLLLANRVHFETLKAERYENNRKKDEAMRAELAATERLLSDRRDQLTKQEEKGREKKIKASEELKILGEDILRKKRLINQKKVIVDDLQSKKREKQLEAQKMMMLPKQCQQSGHVKKLKEQEQEIEALNKQLSAEKIKLKQIKRKNKEAERKENEKHAAQEKKNKSCCDNLKKKLAAVDKEIEDLKEKLEKTKASNAAKDTRESSDINQLRKQSETNREAIPTASTHKSILKLGSKGPLKIQKVQFDFGISSRSPLRKVDSSSAAFKEGRHYAASVSKLGWVKTDLPTSSQQRENPSPAADVRSSSTQFNVRGLFSPATQTQQSPLKLESKDTPLSVEKTQFDPTPIEKFNFLSLFDKAKREYDISADKPDWAKIGLPSSLQQSETPSPAVDAIPATQTHKRVPEVRAKNISSRAQKTQFGTISSSQPVSKPTDLSKEVPKKATPKKFFKSRNRK